MQSQSHLTFSHALQSFSQAYNNQLFLVNCRSSLVGVVTMSDSFSGLDDFVQCRIRAINSHLSLYFPIQQPHCSN